MRKLVTLVIFMFCVFCADIHAWKSLQYEFASLHHMDSYILSCIMQHESLNGSEESSLNLKSSSIRTKVTKELKSSHQDVRHYFWCLPLLGHYEYIPILPYKTYGFIYGAGGEMLLSKSHKFGCAVLRNHGFYADEKYNNLMIMLYSKWRIAKSAYCIVNCGPYIGSNIIEVDAHHNSYFLKQNNVILKTNFGFCTADGVMKYADYDIDFVALLDLDLSYLSEADIFFIRIKDFLNILQLKQFRLGMYVAKNRAQQSMNPHGSIVIYLPLEQMLEKNRLHHGACALDFGLEYAAENFSASCTAGVNFDFNKRICGKFNAAFKWLL